MGLSFRIFFAHLVVTTFLRKSPIYYLFIIYLIGRPSPFPATVDSGVRDTSQQRILNEGVENYAGNIGGPKPSAKNLVAIGAGIKADCCADI